MNSAEAKGSGIDFIYINGRHEPLPELDYYIRCMVKLSSVQKVTDIAKLPEYLSDEDLDVREAATVKLEELTRGRG